MDLSYPIGRFEFPAAVTAEMRGQMMDELAGAPARVREAVRGLDEAQLDTPYRPGGWTVRQVVHHLPDSHGNSYMRFRLALTEETPTVKPFDEAKWAELADYRKAPVEISLAMLEGIHGRWDAMLRSLTDADFARTFRHMDLGVIRLDSTLAPVLLAQPAPHRSYQQLTGADGLEIKQLQPNGGLPRPRTRDCQL